MGNRKYGNTVKGLEDYRQKLIRVLPETFEVLKLEDEDRKCMYVRVSHKDRLFAFCIEIDPVNMWRDIEREETL